jgi:hypothetical protein
VGTGVRRRVSRVDWLRVLSFRKLLWMSMDRCRCGVHAVFLLVSHSPFSNSKQVIELPFGLVNHSIIIFKNVPPSDF